MKLFIESLIVGWALFIIFVSIFEARKIPNGIIEWVSILAGLFVMVSWSVNY